MDTQHTSFIPKLKKILLLVVGIAIAVGILGFFYDYSERSRAAIENNVEFYFTPSIIKIGQSQQVTVDVHASSIQSVSGATALIKYPKNLLVFDKSTTQSQLVDSCNSLETVVDVRDVAGQGNYNTIILTRVSKNADSDLPKNTFCVARLFFATKNPGNDKITFESNAVEGWNFDVSGPAGHYFPILEGTKPKQVDVTITEGQDGPYTYKGFVTSDSYAGNTINGLEGADTICQQHAANAGLPGEWFAFLSTANSGAAYSRNAFDRFTHADVPIYSMSGDLIAQNLDELRSCDGSKTNCIQNPIGVDETGKKLFTVTKRADGGIQVTPASGVTDLYAWTGTLVYMTTNPYPDTENSCGNWTSTQGKAIIGEIFQTDKSWVSYDGVSCTEKHRLYCFSYNNAPLPHEITPTVTSSPITPTVPPGYADSCKDLYNTFWKHQNTTCSDNNYSAVADVNKDGKVNSDDINLISQNKANGDYCKKQLSDTTNVCKGSNVPVNFRLKLQGIISQPKNSSAVSIQIKLVEGNKVVNTKQVEFKPQADGAYVANTTYENISLSKKYSFLIKGPKHIQKRICVNSPSENISGTYRCKDSNVTFKAGGNTLDFTNIILLSGDIPLQNGIVDAVDIAYVRNNVGRSDPDIVARGDINFDGVVDSQDYTLVINALAFKYDE